MSDVRIDRVDVTGVESWGAGMVYLYGVGIDDTQPVPYSLLAELKE